jgi:hypothetical protein
VPLDHHRLELFGAHDGTQTGAAGRMVFPGNDAGKAGTGLTGGSNGKDLHILLGQVGGNAVLGLEGIQPPITGLASLISAPSFERYR